MITLRKDGWEVEVPNVNAAIDILKGKKKNNLKQIAAKECLTKEKTKRRLKYSFKCRNCGKIFGTNRVKAKYCSRRCSGVINVHKAIKARAKK